jgi:hypothetical protein
MSCWIVDRQNIINLVAYMRRNEDNFYCLQKADIKTDEDFIGLANEMEALNISSYNQRYSAEEKVDGIESLEEHEPLTIYQFLKSLHCFMYQSCEGDCMDNKLYKLEEYDKAEWK